LNGFLVVTVSVDRKARRLKGSAALLALTAKIDKSLGIKIYYFYQTYKNQK